ncbi:major facilitator superfamily domain-containing protein [Xylariales sp. PMI_506]|nr:major facilitator superfamily domain-containing protein [Xylariales sp. PMI_506]
MVRFFRKTVPVEVPEVEPTLVPGPEPEKALNSPTQVGEKAEPAIGDASDSDETVSTDAQEGVKDIEAMAKVWSRSHLILAYVLIWLIYFVNAMQEGTTNTLAIYVTSSFSAAPLTTAAGVMSSLFGGLCKLPLAKIIDVWGRPQGYFLMVVMMTVGLIMMAACQNVETYAAAQVFYWVGYDGLLYIISVFVSDISSLKNRGLMFAWISSPYIITAWINGYIATAFLDGPGFRWSFGAFAIIMPFVTLSLWVLLVINYRKAKQMGVLVPRAASGRTKWQSFKHYVEEFDIIGLMLILTGLALFLLSFNIYSYQSKGWKAPIIICFIVIGGLLIIAFGIWEKYFARVKFIPYEILTDRTCLGAFIVSGGVFVSFYLWDGYFYSFLIIVQNLSVVNATYVLNTYTIGSCLWSFVVGYAIRKTGHFKWIAVYFAVPMTMLGAGLMIQFRQPQEGLNYIIMCQIFIALAGGGIVITEQIAALAATSHQYVAVVLAIEGMFSSVGGAIGSSIATAIYTGVMPKKLAEYLPAESQANLTAIYGSIVVQEGYAVGTPTRLAIDYSYGDTQKLLCIAATVILIIPWIACMCWRDINVKNFKQVKGNVI